MWVWVRLASGSSGCVEYFESTCGRWSSVSESLPAYGAIGSAVGRGDGTPLNLGELRIPEMDFRLPPKNPTALVVRSVKLKNEDGQKTPDTKQRPLPGVLNGRPLS